MTANLNSQYDNVVDKLTEYYQFERRILRRFMNPIKNFSLSFRFSKRIMREISQLDDVAAKRPVFFSEFMGHLATPAELDDPKFQIVVSDYPVDSLSRELEENFTDYDFGKLAKLHRSRFDKHAKFNLSIRNILGVVFGAGSLVLHFTPQPVVESFNGDYEAFRIWVFWITLGAVAYIATIVGVTWFPKIRSLHRMEFISDVLDYTALRLTSNAS